MKLSTTCALHNLQKPRREWAHRTRGKHTQFKPHWKAICITSHHGHMEMFSEKFSTQQQREDLLYMANNLSPQSRICSTKKPNQTATDCTFQTPPAISMLKLASNCILCFYFCSVILKILMFLFNSAWCEPLISPKSRPKSSPKYLCKYL